MKKLLFQFDTDHYPSAFDSTVAYDGGADRVLSYGGVCPDNVSGLVDGVIFTRPATAKQNSAIFIGGSNIAAGSALLGAINKQFFAGFQVSVMLDSNGCNTTAATAIAAIAAHISLKGKKTIVLGGTGPVGQRAAAFAALEGADVSITSRNLSTATTACQAISDRFGVSITPIAAADCEARFAAIKSANIVLATGASGVQMLAAKHWQNLPYCQAIVDTNATPPLGIGGIDLGNKQTMHQRIATWGALGFGGAKLQLHRHCIGQLFTNNQQVLDGEIIFRWAMQLTQRI